MKRLFIIGGSMGVGKTAACNILKTKLENSVFLDGDWCWDAHPFIVNDETKAMVMDNICYLLNNFLKCSAYDNIVFCWVLHEQNILDDLLSRKMVLATSTIFPTERMEIRQDEFGQVLFAFSSCL